MQWLSWLSGLGHVISLGRDHILGLGEISLLSRDLIDYLRKEKISVLSQAKTVQDSTDYTGNWIGSTDLGLSGNLEAEWELFRKELIGDGVSIRDTPNQLMWT